LIATEYSAKLLCASSVDAVSVRVTHDAMRAPAIAISVSRGVSGLGFTTVSVSVRSRRDADPFRPQRPAGFPFRS
jgi:hypothetical protein